MRIVDLPTFISLPSGTLYHEYYSSNTGPLCKKYESVSGNDWIYESFDGFPSNNGSDQLFDRLSAMENDGAQFPLDVGGTMRDGTYPSSGMFMVYDADDVASLIKAITG
jgi:hypothetical protein